MFLNVVAILPTVPSVAGYFAAIKLDSVSIVLVVSCSVAAMFLHFNIIVLYHYGLHMLALLDFAVSVINWGIDRKHFSLIFNIAGSNLCGHVASFLTLLVCLPKAKKGQDKKQKKKLKEEDFDNEMKS